MLEDPIRLKNINHITYNVKDKDAAWGRGHGTGAGALR